MAPSSVTRPTLALTSQTLKIDDETELRATDKKNQCFNARTRSSKPDRRSSLVSQDKFIGVNDKRGYSVKEQIDERERGARRRERISKKLGRKPIVSEPTSKRKAQNRAAQRAFRERKEKHLQELEAKVENLEKVSEETIKENRHLRAHLEKVLVELNDYRGKYPLLMKANQNPNYYELPSYLPVRTHETSHVASNSNVDFRFDCPIYKNLPYYPMETNAPQTVFNTQLMPTSIPPARAEPSSQNIPLSGAISKPKIFNYSAAKVQKANFSNLPKLLDNSLSECTNNNTSLFKNNQFRIQDPKSEPNIVHTKSVNTNFSSKNYNDTYCNLYNSSVLSSSNLGKTVSSLENPQERTKQPFIINEPHHAPRKLNRHDPSYPSELEQDKLCRENSTVYQSPNYTLPQLSSCRHSEIDIGEFEPSSFPNNSADWQTRLFNHQTDLQLYESYRDPQEYISSSGVAYNNTKESSILVPATHDTVSHKNSSMFDKGNQNNRRLSELEPTLKDLYDSNNILDRIKPFSSTIHNSLDLEKLCRDLKKKPNIPR